MAHQWFEQFMNNLSSRGLEEYLSELELIHDYWHGKQREFFEFMDDTD